MVEETVETKVPDVLNLYIAPPREVVWAASKELETYK